MPTTTTVTHPDGTVVKASGGAAASGFAGAVCIVTGGAQGIGYGISEGLASRGASLICLVDLREEQLVASAKELGSAFPGTTFMTEALDVRDPAAVDAAWQRTAAAGGGKLDILVQAAGVVGKTKTLTADVTPEDWDFVMGVNVKGIFLGCRSALPIMEKNGYGRIVNIASVAGKEGNAGMLAYSTSKAAVIGLTKTTGKEYCEKGITVNAIAPAVVRTKMVDDMPAAQVKYMTDKIPMKRCGLVTEIANLACFIASPECSFTTGFCFDATGGRSVY